MPPIPATCSSSPLGGALRGIAPAAGVELATAMQRVKARLLRRRTAAPQLGRYTLFEEIGRGGLGVVYRARDGQLQRDVAIKVLQRGAYAPRGDATPNRDPDPALVTEARALATLNHPNIVSVFDCGVAEITGQAPDVFIVMELLEGVSLARWLDAPRSTGEILAAFVAAGRGLAAAHRRGLVHRDFKPDNVLVGADGLSVKVTDFGLACPMQRTTSVEGYAGTPMYMAPEQRERGRASVASDQFAFCVSLALALDRHRVPRRIRGVIERGLDPDPSRRFPSMDALLQTMTRRIDRRWSLLAGLPAVGLALGLVAWGGDSRPTCARTPSADVCIAQDEPVADLTDDPQARAEIEQARAQLRQGDETAARTLLEHGFLRAALARDDEAAFDAAASLAYVAGYLGTDPEAAERWRTAAATLRSAAADPLDRARLQHVAATVEQKQGHHRSAARGFEAALAIYEGPDVAGVDPAELTVRRVNSLNGLGISQTHLGAADEGLATLRAALQLCERSFGDFDRRCATVLTNLANTEHRRGHTREAIVLAKRALTIREQLGPDHPRVADALTALGLMWFSLTEHDEAEPLHRRALAIYEQRLGHDALLTAMARYNLALVASQTGRTQAARRGCEEALAAMQKILPADDPRIVTVLGTLGGIAGDQGDHDAAIETLERTLAIQQNHATSRRALASTRFNLATSLVAAGRDQTRAIDLARQARADLEAVDAPAAHRDRVERWLWEHTKS